MVHSAVFRSLRFEIGHKFFIRCFSVCTGHVIRISLACGTSQKRHSLIIAYMSRSIRVKKTSHVPIYNGGVRFPFVGGEVRAVLTFRTYRSRYYILHATVTKR